MPFDYRAYKAQYDKDHYDALLTRLPKGIRAQLVACAKSQGKSLNRWVVEVLMAAANIEQ